MALGSVHPVDTDYASHGHLSNAPDFLPFAHGVVEVGLDHLSASSGPFVLGWTWGPERPPFCWRNRFCPEIKPRFESGGLTRCSLSCQMITRPFSWLARWDSHSAVNSFPSSAAKKPQGRFFLDLALDFGQYGRSETMFLIVEYASRQELTSMCIQHYRYVLPPSSQADVGDQASLSMESTR